MNSGRPRHRLGFLALAALILTACGSTKPEAPPPPPDRVYGQFDDVTRRMAEQLMQAALETQPSGDTESWRGDDGRSAHVTPLRSFRIRTGHYCRDFSLVVLGNSGSLSATRTACRSSEGQWIDVTAQKTTRNP